MVLLTTHSSWSFPATLHLRSTGVRLRRSDTRASLQVRFLLLSSANVGILNWYFEALTFRGCPAPPPLLIWMINLFKNSSLNSVSRCQSKRITWLIFFLQFAWFRLWAPRGLNVTVARCVLFGLDSVLKFMACQCWLFPCECFCTKAMN